MMGRGGGRSGQYQRTPATANRIEGGGRTQYGQGTYQREMVMDDDERTMMAMMRGTRGQGQRNVFPSPQHTQSPFGSSYQRGGGQGQGVTPFHQSTPSSSSSSSYSYGNSPSQHQYYRQQQQHQHQQVDQLGRRSQQQHFPSMNASPSSSQRGGQHQQEQFFYNQTTPTSNQYQSPSSSHQPRRVVGGMPSSPFNSMASTSTPFFGHQQDPSSFSHQRGGMTPSTNNSPNFVVGERTRRVIGVQESIPSHLLPSNLLSNDDDDDDRHHHQRKNDEEFPSLSQGAPSTSKTSRGRGKARGPRTTPTTTEERKTEQHSTATGTSGMTPQQQQSKQKKRNNYNKRTPH